MNSWRVRPIIAEIENLTAEEKRVIFLSLARSLKASEDTMPRAVRILEKYNGIMTEMMGYDVMLSKSRVYPRPILRTLIAREMRDEGVTFQKIAQVMKKNHGTICTMVQKIEYIIAHPESDPSVFELYRQFKSKIKENENQQHQD